MTNNAHQLAGLQDLTPADAAWAVWNKAWTRYARRHAARNDLTVVVAPGAGAGAPACFYPDHHRIEVNAAFLGGDPTVADPARAIHRHVVPAAYGLLVHEAAHAAHSLWRVPNHTPPVVAEVALMLEESRIESRQRGRRRGDRRYLRRAAAEFLLPSTPVVDDPWHAGFLAGLLLARGDARILTSKELRAVRAAIVGVLSKDRLHQIRAIWQTAHTCDDTDATTMIDLAWRWCRILGVDPANDPDGPQSDPGEFPGRLAAALADLVAAVLGISRAELDARIIAVRNAPPSTWTRRAPTEAEQAAARRLGARLRQARTEHREPGTQPAAVPPGRLRTRQAIALDAQTATGMTPTAQPWQRRTILPPPKPTLRLAVVVDVSVSMWSYLGPLSTAAWVLANGARGNDAITATIAFDDTAAVVVAPRHRPTDVLDMGIGFGSSGFCGAVKLADHVLDLRSRRSLRMLAVVSDGDFPNGDAAQKMITTLARSGCPVLWLRPAGLSGETFAHTTTITVTDPVEAVETICDAAVTALQQA